MNPLQLHVAGATIVHANPFSALEVPVDTNMLDIDLRETWVRPLYFGLHKTEAKDFITKNSQRITSELIAKLLANFDWRPRSVAAYLVAVSDESSFTTNIGRLLLRSDVCYAGAAYCLALASLNSAESIAFLEEYLAYYLKQNDLWFDQAHAMAALTYLDDANGTVRADRFRDDWAAFIQNKQNWNLDNSIIHFSQSMTNLKDLKSHLR
jgi:hypothetical protein